MFWLPIQIRLEELVKPIEGGMAETRLGLKGI